MVVNMPSNIEWNDDGHALILRLEQADITVAAAPCPFDEAKEDAACYHKGIAGCIVNYFVQMYGLEVNIGVAQPAGHMPILWTAHGDDYDIDSAQVWIIPEEDEYMSDWLEIEREDLE